MLLLMPTDHQKSSQLFAGWRPKKPSFLRRGSTTPVPEDSVLSLGSLPTRRPSKSSNSEESHSVRSSASRGRALTRAISRIRSTSNFSNKSNKSLNAHFLSKKDFEKTEDWLGAFAKFTQYVTNQISEDDPEKFNAICTILTSKFKGGFVHGLPEAMFDLALLWCPSTELDRKAVEAKKPSWSWVGWENKATGLAVNFPFDFTSCPDARGSEHREIFRSEINHFYIGTQEAKQPELYELVRSRDRTRTEFYRMWVPKIDDPKNTDALHFEAHTIVAHNFSIEQLKYSDEEDKMPICNLLDENNRHCGVIMDYQNLLSAPAVVPGPLHDTALGSLEFVLLSRNRRCKTIPTARRFGSNTAHPPGTPVWKDGRFLWEQELQDFEEPHFKDGDWKVLNVMLVQHFSGQTETGQVQQWAERVAIGRIHEDAWKAQTSKFKEIILK